MQFQLSVCMYSTCGRIDNKADFDLTLTLISIVDNLIPEVCQKTLYLF